MCEGGKVSVVIPTFNAEKYVHRAISSVVEQEGARFEILLVDNNSTDATFTVLTDWARKHPQLIRVFKQPIQGVSAARNLGLKNATGEFTQFLDADDVLLPGKLERQVRILAEDKALGFIMGASYERFEGDEMKRKTPDQDPWLGLVTGFFGHTNANLYRSDILRSINGQDEKMRTGEDVDMLYRLLKRGFSCQVDETPGSMYIHHSGARLSDENIDVGLEKQIMRDIKVNNFLRSARTDYYEQNKRTYISYMIHKLRMLSTKNLNAAFALHDIFFGEKEKYLLDYDILPWFTALYQVAGFKRIESLRVKMEPMLPMILKKWVKNV